MSAHYIVTDIYSNGWYLCLCIEDNEYLCGVANIHEYFHSHLYFSSNGPRHMIVMAILNERTRTWPVLWLKMRNLKIQKLFFNKFYFLKFCWWLALHDVVKFKLFLTNHTCLTTSWGSGQGTKEHLLLLDFQPEK